MPHPSRTSIFDFLLRLIIFRFLLVVPVVSWPFSCFLQIWFSANTIWNFFAIVSSFLCSNLNFLPVAANLPPVHYLRNGPALPFL